VLDYKYINKYLTIRETIIKGKSSKLISRYKGSLAYIISVTNFLLKTKKRRLPESDSLLSKIKNIILENQTNSQKATPGTGSTNIFTKGCL
jgi:hypothetical protein